nr:hypothetical protein [uncultured Rhodopila sp.]
MPRGFFVLLMLAAPVGAAADEAAKPADTTGAFETAYAASFYEFDACGDGLSGRTYRRALSEKVAHCPFPADVKQRFVQRAAAQRQKSAKAMAKLIEDNGGLPVRLEGMTRTCREQSETPEYQAIRARLDAFSVGKLGVDGVVAAACDAAEINP